MPGTKDFFLASLVEKDVHKNSELICCLHTIQQVKLDNTNSLVPPELIEQYDNEFMPYFWEVMLDSKILSSTFFSFNHAEENEKNRLQIFREHNYCRNPSNS